MSRHFMIIVAALFCGGAAHATEPLPAGSAIVVIVPLAKYSPPSVENIYYSHAEETRKAAVRAASGYRDPNSRSMCPPPFHMSERDGCR